MITGELTLDFRQQRVFELFLNDPGTTTDDKLFVRQSLGKHLTTFYYLISACQSSRVSSF
jgi:hypothetical protein